MGPKSSLSFCGYPKLRGFIPPAAPKAHPTNCSSAPASSHGHRESLPTSLENPSPIPEPSAFLDINNPSPSSFPPLPVSPTHPLRGSTNPPPQESSMGSFPPFLAPGSFSLLSKDRKAFRTKQAEIPAGMAGYNSSSCSGGLLGAMDIWTQSTLQGFSGHCSGLEASSRIHSPGIPAFPEPQWLFTAAGPTFPVIYLLQDNWQLEGTFGNCVPPIPTYFLPSNCFPRG